MSKLLSYEEWYINYGAEIEEQLDTWFNNAPKVLDINEIFGSELQTFISDIVEGSYIDYISGYGDYIYEQRREERLGL